jgi:ABC-type antimicrobial peptide transport system permease subunit
MRHKLFTFINIIGLSIGISAALVIFLIVYRDFTFDQFHKDGNRIYRVVTDYEFSGDPFYNNGVPGPLPEAVRHGVTGVEETAPLWSQSYDVTIPGITKQKFKDNEEVVYADRHYFNLFNYKWLVGSPKVLEQPYMVVLRSDQAKVYFPNLSYEQMIGKQVVYADSIRATVAGIVDKFKQNSDFTYHDFISFSTTDRVNDIKQQNSSWENVNGSGQVFIKLAQGSNTANIEKQLHQLQVKNQPEQAKADGGGYRSKFRLQPLSDIHFNANYGAINSTAANKTMLYGLIAIAAFLLLLGCINFVNLTTAQASQRAKEIGVRKTMGSSRGQLIAQFLSETFLITLSAVIISIVLAPFILKLFADFVSKDVKLDIMGHPVIILFILLLVLLVSFVSGFYPAMVLSGYKPITVLKNQSTDPSTTRNAWLRKTLTVSQFVIAQFFIMATILVGKQIHYALNKDLGFKKDAIVYVNLPWKAKPGKKQVFLNAVKSLPQVQLVSYGGDVPSSAGWSSNDAMYIDGKKEIKTELYHKSGDENYIKVYHIKLLAGRNITLADTAGNMLINDTYAHILGFTNPAKAIGKLVKFGRNGGKQIVGVVADFHQGSLRAPIKPMAIYPEPPQYEGVVHIALKPQTAGGNEWKTAIASMQTTWKQLFPDDDFQCNFFDESIAKMYVSDQHISTLLTWATGISIFISCLGLFGLAIYTTNLRTKEIGVRKVLGATVSQIVVLLSREMVVLIILAFVLASAASWYAMNKWMQGFADRTTISWWIFALSGAGMLITALLTSAFQTVRAAMTNPVNSLRSE